MVFVQEFEHGSDRGPAAANPALTFDAVTAASTRLETDAPDGRLLALAEAEITDAGAAARAALDTGEDGLRRAAGNRLLSALTGLERIAARVAALRADTLIELTALTQAPHLPAQVAATSALGDTTVLVGYEIAPILRLAPTTAATLVREAVILTEDLPATHTALRTGQVSYAQARVICETLTPLRDPDLRATAEHRALTQATTLAPGALRRATERIITTLDAATVKARVQRARTDRDVHTHTRTDGLAEVIALLPTEDATALMTAVHAGAATLHHHDRHNNHGDRDQGDDDQGDGDRPGDGGRGGTGSAEPAAERVAPRTMAQCRADTLATMAWTALATGGIGCHHTPHHTDTPHDTDTTTATAGPDTARPDTAGPDTAGPGHAGQGARSDHSDTADPAAGDPAGPGGPAGDGLAAGGLADGGEGRLRFGSHRRRPVTVHVTIPLNTLIGLDEDPVQLPGDGGVIPADVARRLAADGTWRRLLTDPATGALLDYGTTRYEPPPDLVTAVQVRDGTCRFPTCTHPARASQLDHTIPFNHHHPENGGPTTYSNLAALSHRCHQLKTHTGWTLTQEHPGHLTWTSPLGRIHHVYPQPIGPAPTTRPPEATEQTEPAKPRRSAAETAAHPEAGPHPEPHHPEGAQNDRLHDPWRSARSTGTDTNTGTGTGLEKFPF